MQANPKHQQHHTDFGELCRDINIGDEAGCERIDEDAGQQITDQRRELDPRSKEAQQEGQPERRGNSRN